MQNVSYFSIINPSVGGKLDIAHRSIPYPATNRIMPLHVKTILYYYCKIPRIPIVIMPQEYDKWSYTPVLIPLESKSSSDLYASHDSRASFKFLGPYLLFEMMSCMSPSIILYAYISGDRFDREHHSIIWFKAVTHCIKVHHILILS